MIVKIFDIEFSAEISILRPSKPQKKVLQIFLSVCMLLRDQRLAQKILDRFSLNFHKTGILGQNITKVALNFF